MLVDIESGFLVYIIIFITYYLKKLRRKTSKEQLEFTLIYIYICAIIDITILPIPLTSAKVAYNLEFDYYGNKMQMMPLILLRDGSGIYEIFRNYLLNTIMFVPMGIIVSQTKRIPRKTLIRIITIFTISLAIELTQLFMSQNLGTQRFFDVDDLIFNTLGGTIGYITANTFVLYKEMKEKNDFVNQNNINF